MRSKLVRTILCMTLMTIAVENANMSIPSAASMVPSNSHGGDMTTPYPSVVRGAAVGLLALLRNEGGSVGTSVAQIIQERREQFTPFGSTSTSTRSIPRQIDC